MLKEDIIKFNMQSTTKYLPSIMQTKHCKKKYKWCIFDEHKKMFLNLKTPDDLNIFWGIQVHRAKE
jgi:hypothetical protein